MALNHQEGLGNKLCEVDDDAPNPHSSTQAQPNTSRAAVQVLETHVSPWTTLGRPQHLLDTPGPCRAAPTAIQRPAVLHLPGVEPADSSGNGGRKHEVGVKELSAVGSTQETVLKETPGAKQQPCSTDCQWPCYGLEMQKELGDFACAAAVTGGGQPCNAGELGLAWQVILIQCDDNVMTM